MTGEGGVEGDRIRPHTGRRRPRADPPGEAPPRSHFASTTGLDTSRCSDATGVGSDPVKPLPGVWSARACSAQRRSPEGVAHGFHVSVNAVEPCPSSSAGNLLAKHDARRSLADELSEDGPEVPSVVDSCALACDTERLARARAGPHGAVIGPACKPQREAPSADAGEEVTLVVGNKVSCSNIGDTPLVNVARRDEPARDQATKPSRRERVDLVVVNGHAAPHASTLATRSVARYRVPTIPG